MEKSLMMIINPAAGKGGYKINFAEAMHVLDKGGYRTKAWTESKKYIPFPQTEMDATANTPHPMTQNNY